MEVKQRVDEALEYIKKNISARKIINKASLENAIRVCMATGGSTNAALHLPAIA
ncbi:dihydroxy-acid dehydratase domain-containing protein, partial [Acetomicrobium sp. S15 = DSM 107314]|uniref:dihydroxy-acid dehydratase domain-containing protein n=1 Tax=Acetomicrobium sp. S15 = DSM 107314 TaxID=2529858 RepID=UPI0018E1B7F8